MSAQTPSPSPDGGLDQPLLVGDHPALNFMNSVIASEGGPIDSLRDGASMLKWLAASGAVSSVLADAAAGFSSQQLDRAATEVRALRELFRDLLFRWSATGARGVRPADLDRLNALLARGCLLQSLSRASGRIEFRTARDAGKPAAIAAELAAACADLLANCPAEQVRKCENPACTLWFADTKRGPRRRWCSMAICGNRLKVAAHRARNRAEKGGAGR